MGHSFNVTNFFSYTKVINNFYCSAQEFQKNLRPKHIIVLYIQKDIAKTIVVMDLSTRNVNIVVFKLIYKIFFDLAEKCTTTYVEVEQKKS